MKTILLPRAFSTIGWILLVPSLLLGIFIIFIEPGSSWGFYGTGEVIVNDIAIIGSALGALFVTCARLRQEDEMTMALRLHSMLLAIYIYVGILVVSTLAVNGLPYSYFMVVNLAMFPVIFAFVFRIKLLHYFKQLEDEK